MNSLAAVATRGFDNAANSVFGGSGAGSFNGDDGGAPLCIALLCRVENGSPEPLLPKSLHDGSSLRAATAFPDDF